MNDRQPTKPNRVKITFDDGTVQFGYIERADEPTVEGTPLNKANLFDNHNSERYACNVPSEAFTLLTQGIIVTVPANGWSNSANSDGYYTQSVNVVGMRAVYEPIFAPEIGVANNADDINESFSLIARMVTENDKVTFLATEPLTNNITVRLKGI